MLAVTLVIALVVSLAAVAWVVWPLLNRAPALPLVEDDRLSALIARKEAVMTAIKDLEFDFRVGKLDQEDYDRYDQRLRRQAIGLIQQIETAAPQSTGLDVKLESEIMHRRKVTGPAVSGAAVAVAAAAVAQPAATAQTVGTHPHPSNGGAAVAVGQPVAVAAAMAATTVAATGASAGARFCTNCGARLEVQHKFCANCGTPVNV